MKLELSLPHHLRLAREQHWPLLIPAGTVEYHGEHLSLGCDTLLVTGILAELERRLDCIIAPPIWYGPASYAVAGPEQGTIDVNVDRFEQHVRDILRGYLEMGLRNIVVIIHHQYERGIELPMALSFLKSAKMLVFELLEKKHGRGWWGDPENARFYETLEEKDNPWNWVRVIPLMSPDVQAQTGYDHAGKHETSFLMAVCPEAVDLSVLSSKQPWFVQEAKNATKEYGERIKNMVIDQLTKVIRG